MKMHSSMSPEERKYAQRYNKMSHIAAEIKDDYYETVISFDEDGNEVFRHTDNEHSSVGIGNHDPSDFYYHWTVHNHPEGNCFSWQDLQLAQWVKESWAVTKEYIQIFRWNSPPTHLNSDKRSEFFKKVDKMHGDVVRKAIDECLKKYPIDPRLPWNEYDKAQKARDTQIEKLAQKKQREWFKNNAKEYGYTFSVKHWPTVRLSKSEKESLRSMGFNV